MRVHFGGPPVYEQILYEVEDPIATITLNREMAMKWVTSHTMLGGSYQKIPGLKHI